MLDGKKVVGPTGGTFRATARMREALGRKFELESAKRPPFQKSPAWMAAFISTSTPIPKTKFCTRRSWAI